MKTYYAFLVNDYFSSFYQEKPSVLYQIFDQVYQLNKDDIVLGYRIFEQISIPFDKDLLNNHFYNSHCQELSYARKTDKHYYNNLYIQEDTKVLVYHSHIKFKTNIPYPTLMHSLKEFHDNVFICDFDSKEYFWLSQADELGLVKS